MVAYAKNPWNMTPAEEPSAVSLGADARGEFVLHRPGFPWDRTVYRFDL